MWCRVELGLRFRRQPLAVRQHKRCLADPAPIVDNSLRVLPAMQFRRWGRTTRPIGRLAVTKDFVAQGGRAAQQVEGGRWLKARIGRGPSRRDTHTCGALVFRPKHGSGLSSVWTAWEGLPTRTSCAATAVCAWNAAIVKVLFFCPTETVFLVKHAPILDGTSRTPS